MLQAIAFAKSLQKTFQNYFADLILCTAFFGFLPNAHSAPVPATSTGALTQLESARFLHRLGIKANFEIFSGANANDISKDPLLALQIQPSDSQLVSLRKQNRPTHLNVEALAKSLARDVAVYGFSTLQVTRQAAVQGEIVVADLKHKKEAILARQYLIFSPREILTINCQSKTADFEKLIQRCNQMVSTLKLDE